MVVRFVVDPLPAAARRRTSTPREWSTSTVQPGVAMANTSFYDTVDEKQFSQEFNIISPDKRYVVSNYKNVFIPTNVDVKKAVKKRFAEWRATAAEERASLLERVASRRGRSARRDPSGIELAQRPTGTCGLAGGPWPGTGPTGSPRPERCSRAIFSSHSGIRAAYPANTSIWIPCSPTRG